MMLDRISGLRITSRDSSAPMTPGGHSPQTGQSVDGVVVNSRAWEMGQLV